MCFCGLTSLNTNQGMEHQNLVYKCSLHHLLILANCLLISYHNKPSLQILFPQSRRPSSRLLGSVKYHYHFVKQLDNIFLGLTILSVRFHQLQRKMTHRVFLLFQSPRVSFPSWPGIGPWPPALGTRNLSHWTTREVPPQLFLYVILVYPMRHGTNLFATLCLSVT